MRNDDSKLIKNMLNPPLTLTEKTNQETPISRQLNKKIRKKVTIPLIIFLNEK